MLKRTYLRLVEMQEEQARQHLEEVRSIYNEMRGYKHDFHHHLQALKGQLEAGQVDPGHRLPRAAGPGPPDRSIPCSRPAM